MLGLLCGASVGVGSGAGLPVAGAGVGVETKFGPCIVGEVADPSEGTDSADCPLKSPEMLGLLALEAIVSRAAITC